MRLLAADQLLHGRITMKYIFQNSTMESEGAPMDDPWSAVEAMSTTFAAIVVLIGLLYAKTQVGEARRTRHAELLLGFQDRYHASDMRLIRRRLVTGEFGPPAQFQIARLGKAERYAVLTLVDQLEMLGVLVDKGLLDIDLVVAAFRSTPPQVWYYIRPHVLEMRKQRPAGYCFYLEKLAERYEKHHKEQYGVPHPAYERIAKLEASESKSDRI